MEGDKPVATVLFIQCTPHVVVQTLLLSFADGRSVIAASDPCLLI